MYWFSLLAGSVSTGQQEKERKKTDRAYDRAYHDQEPANLIRLPVAYNAGYA